jgi:hypothetical protein
MTATFAELATMKSGTILERGYENGVRYLIVRGPLSLCVYVGVPEGHPLTGKDYNDLPLNVHGGLTFAGKGDGYFRPAGMYWYGWDYGHSGDVSFYDLDSEMPRLSSAGDKRWTVEDLKGEIWSATYDFAKLMRLAESIMPNATFLASSESSPEG